MSFMMFHPLQLAAATLLVLAQTAAAAANLKPTADAGDAQSVGLGVDVYLDGSQSHDSDGAIKRYAWRQLGGQKVKLLDPKSPTPRFVSPAQLSAKPAANQLRFKLTVADDRNKKASATVTVALIACAPPERLVDGACQAPQPPPACLPPNVLKNGACVPPPVLVCAPPLVASAGVCRLPALVCAAPEVPQNGVCALPVANPHLNDTGITTCSDSEHNGAVCPLANYPGQDAEFGRDLLFDDDSDGRAGFSFLKIGADGGELPNDAAAWDCVQDRVTGLVWENKTDDDGPRDKDRQFSHYRAFDPSGEFQSAGDADGYLNAINAEGLCGHHDWRLPTVQELQGIVDYGAVYPGPALDGDFFRFAKNNPHWTATDHAAKADHGWVVYFDDGRVFDDLRSQRFSVRLVRGEAAQASPFAISADGQEVTDLDTGLIWQRCAYGMTWENGGCQGSAWYFMWYEALPATESFARAKQTVWRLPNVKELANLADRSRIHQAIDDAAFPNTPNAPFWSASPYAADAFYAWEVNFFDGAVYYSYLEDLAAIRLVRDAR